MILSFAYSFYLNFEFSNAFYPDYVTHKVANQSKWLVNAIGYNCTTEPHPDEASVKLFVDNNFVVRVLEGCNGVSVLVLFTAFVFSFFQGWKRTLLFLVMGGILIYIINIVRIAIISIALYETPQYTKVLHDIVFPGAIYGTVVILWLIWVNGFKKYKV